MINFNFSMLNALTGVSGNQWWVWLLVSIVLLLLVAIVVLAVILLYNKKAPKDELPAEVIIIQTEEAVKGEPKAEKAE